MKNGKRQREMKQQNYRELVKANRKVFHLVWEDMIGSWVLKSPNMNIRHIATDNEDKKAFISRCRAFVKLNCQEFHNLGQLIVHGADGEIQFENTYGADPRRSKG